MSPFRHLNDEPVLDDLLQRHEMVERMGKLVATSQPPLVLGIHGDWGAGKTSFLHQLQWYLTGECPQNGDYYKGKDPKSVWPKRKPQELEHVVVIWFEAWRYQNEAAPIVALLQEMRSQLALHQKVWESVKKLGEVAVRGAFLGFEDLTKKVGIRASKIIEAGEKWEKEHYTEAIPSHTIRSLLESAIDRLLGNDEKTERNEKSPKLVILIDDLDRCEGESAHRLLEGIKIYLNLKNCVFVIGMNQDNVQRAIGKALGVTGEMEIVMKGREYLEKICPRVWHLPFQLDPGNLIERLLCYNGKKKLSQDDIRWRIAEIVRENRCLPAIPRKVKSFVDVVERFIEQSEEKKITGNHERRAKLFVILAYLYLFYQDLYRKLLVWPAFYQEILEWCANPPRSLDLDKKKAHIENAGLHEALTGFDPVGIRKQSDTLPTPGPEAHIEAFPDPARGPVFRIQRVVLSLDNVEEDEIRELVLR